eukprot:COSAG02_NODE_416_length_22749_cov_21.264059_6_plen_387_part_00
MDGGGSSPDDHRDDELGSSSFELQDFPYAPQQEEAELATAAAWAYEDSDNSEAQLDAAQLLGDAIDTAAASTTVADTPQLAPPAVKRQRGAEQPAEPHDAGAPGAGDIVKVGYGRLTFGQAEQLLRTDALCCAGERPDYLATVGWASLGNVYKDAVERRRKGIDRWQCKYGKGCVTAATADGQCIIRRSYGKIKVMQQAADGDEAERPLPPVLKFHQFTLELPPRDATAAGAGTGGKGRQVRALVTSQKLFHLLGAKEQGELDPATIDADVYPRPLSAGDSSMHTFKGMLQLTNPQHHKGGSKGTRAWVSFHREGPQGDYEQRGSIIDGKHGAQFSSTSGDFAEYHRRCPDEEPFVEGDVVGLNPWVHFSITCPLIDRCSLLLPSI